MPGPANQYDFIVNPPQSAPPKTGLSMLGGGGSSNKKFFVIVGGGLGLVVLLLLFAFVFSGGNANVDRAVGIVQSQQELIRISDTGSEAADGRLKAAAINIKLTIATQRQQWQTYLTEQGRQLSDQELAAKLNSNVDTELESAQQTGNFDPTFERILSENLRDYAAELRQTHAEAGSAEVRELAEAHFQQLELLGDQLSGQISSFGSPNHKSAVLGLEFLPTTTALSAR